MEQCPPEKRAKPADGEPHPRAAIDDTTPSPAANAAANAATNSSLLASTAADDDALHMRAAALLGDHVATGGSGVSGRPNGKQACEVRSRW